MNKDLTVGEPQSVLWKFSIPMFVSVIFQQLYNMADSVIAGKFAGEDALAAVGASYPITMIFMAIAVGSNIGCSVIISQYFGAKWYEKMKTAIYTTLIASVALSLLLTAAGLVLLATSFFGGEGKLETLLKSTLRTRDVSAFLEGAESAANSDLDRDHLFIQLYGGVQMLSGRRVSHALFQAAELLCPRVRYLSVDAGAEGEELAAWLRAEFGAAVRPPEDAGADVALCFGPEEAPGRTMFHLWGKDPDLAGFVPIPAAGGLPAGLDRLPLLALLWEEGRIQVKQLRFLPPSPKD